MADWLDRVLGRDDAVVAAIYRYETGERIGLNESRRTEWQARAWDYWSRLGELHYPTSQLARLVSRIKWRISIDGEALDDEADEGEPSQTDLFLEEITQPLGVREAVRMLALNFQVAGELWYVWRGDPPQDIAARQREQERWGWTVLSTEDPKLSEAKDNRAWKRVRGLIPDPRDRTKADSPFQALLGVSEELLTLEALSRAQTRSRLSQSGILLRPSSAIFPETNDDGSKRDPFGVDLQRAMAAPIRDEHSPEALAPIDLEVPDNAIEKFRHLVFERPYDEQLHERIERVIRRIALGLDMPAELLLGQASLNHWTAWLLQEETYRSHAEPLAQRCGEVLAAAAELLEPGRVVLLEPDPAELLARRSTVRDALSAAQLGAVGLAFVRKAIGALEDDAATEEDLRMMQAVRSGSVPGPTADERRGPPGEGEPPSAPPAGNGRGASDAPATRLRPMVGATASPTARDLDKMGELLAELDRSLLERLIGAMSMAVDQARSRIGAKVRTKLRGSPEHEAIRDVANADVVATLGARSFELIDVEAAVRESFGPISEWWATTLERARRQLEQITNTPLDEARWREHRAASILLLVDGLTEWTVDQLERAEYELNEAPSDLAREVLAIAGGSPSAVRVEA